MTITTTKLTRASGLCAVAAGILFIGVQIKHPHVDVTFATTTQYTIRETVKVVMATLSLIGITGMYLRQVKQIGILGLIGYLVFGAGYIAILGTQMIGLFVMPFLAHSAPVYVNDVLTVANGGKAIGDIGPMQAFSQIGSLIFLGGGFLFGIALFRANVLARWAAALLTCGVAVTVTPAVVPGINPRLFAIPISIALIGLGNSLWRDQRPAAPAPLPAVGSSELNPIGAR
jgi:hypothetical protein